MAKICKIFYKSKYLEFMRGIQKVDILRKNNFIKKCKINKIFLYFDRMFTEATYLLASVERSRAKRCFNFLAFYYDYFF